ncbi:uncharacterized protein LOC110903547 [Helianthus annuus]|uniref:uncharacterized protein LOC110867335 n=1 Tax=Helianthus annuus TaxID=4232 RepID=UPI000B8F97DA|nr:uncharacterized protein LOC110867335 [Helianthus annuus]XP_021990749.1 uncharacterized protein LOC110887392 [Helianthus annuus]XP_022005102.1 uncharacterized protein LOC110903547 [Helianthus annuus]
METNPPTSELMSPVRSFPNRFFCSDFQNDEEFNAPASAYTYMHVDCSRSSEAPVRSPDVLVSNNFMKNAVIDDQDMDIDEASQDSQMEAMTVAVSGSSHGPSMFAESPRGQLDGCTMDNGIPLYFHITHFITCIVMPFYCRFITFSVLWYRSFESILCF